MRGVAHDVGEHPGADDHRPSIADLLLDRGRLLESREEAVAPVEHVLAHRDPGVAQRAHNDLPCRLSGVQVRDDERPRPPL